jgi:hypothetical protein
MLKLGPGKLFAIAFCISVVPFFFFIRYGEEHGRFDNIGLWFTILGAIQFASLFGASVLAVAWPFRARSRRGRTNT